MPSIWSDLIKSEMNNVNDIYSAGIEILKTNNEIWFCTLLDFRILLKHK